MLVSAYTDNADKPNAGKARRIARKARTALDAHKSNVNASVWNWTEKVSAF